MSVLNFAQEFSRLIIRYTKTPSPNNDLLNAIMPLTEEQIVSTIHHVLSVLIKKDNNNLLQIFNSASAVTIPETSIVQIKCEPNTEDVFRSQDVQSVITDEDSSFSDISVKGIKKEQEDSSSTQKDKKFISQSNPAICINLSRSDTFVCEKNAKEDEEEVFKDSIDTGIIGEQTTDLSSNLFQIIESLNISETQKSYLSQKFSDIFNDLFRVYKNKITEITNELQKCVMDITTMQNDLKQTVYSFPQTTKLLKEVTAKVTAQKLSSFSHSSPNRTSTKNKTPTNTGKLSTSFSKTPTSKLYAENRNIFERRKSTGAIGANATSGKFNESRKIGHSISNTNLSLYKSANSSELRLKLKKNPKYAHVRSTIPKAINQKKKMQ